MERAPSGTGERRALSAGLRPNEGAALAGNVSPAVRAVQRMANRVKAMRYFGCRRPPEAGMAELADAADSKSAGPCGHGGSTPPPGTNLIYYQ